VGRRLAQQLDTAFKLRRRRGVRRLDAAFKYAVGKTVVRRAMRGYFKARSSSRTPSSLPLGAKVKTCHPPVIMKKQTLHFESIGGASGDMILGAVGFTSPMSGANKATTRR